MNGDVSWVGLATSLALVAVAAAVSLWQRLGLERQIAWSAFRALVQLLLVGAALSLLLKPGTSLWWSWAWTAGMVAYAGDVARRRAPEVPRIASLSIMSFGAAAAITLVTYFATPDSFIFFGILHEIALASVLGLAFLRLPAILTLLVAALVIAAPHVLRAPAFDHPWLWWLGLSTVDPRSNDYVPLFPWFGAVLAGIGVTRLAASAGLLERMADVPLGRAARPLTFIGRHSLAFYLIHQPVLIACVWLVAQVAPPTQLSPQEAFTSSCHASCQQVRDKAFCVSYCGCMLDKLGSTNMLSRLDQGDADPQLRARIADLASTCTVETEDTAPEEPQ